MRTRGDTRNIERQLDVLIDDLSGNLTGTKSPSRSHNSRLVDYWESKEYYEERTPSRASNKGNYTDSNQQYHSSHNVGGNINKNSYETSRSSSYNLLTSSNKYNESRSSDRSPERSDSHRDYLYNKYGKFGGTWSPRMPRRSTEEQGWYRNMSKEMGTPRSVSPRKLNVPYMDRAPSPIGRPLSILSRSSLDSREASPVSSRGASPILRHKHSSSRSVSPKSNRNVVIGPVTQMVEARRHQETGKQEYYRGRDSRTGKPLPGRHGFMTYSWPYGLNLIGDAYENPNLRLPADSPPDSKVPYVPPPPIYRRAKSVEPPQVKRLPVISKSEGNTPVPEYLLGLRHIIVEQTPVPTPPRFGTLTYGGRYPNAALAPYVDGPPCELCHKPITESRCIYADNGQYHVWHFYCSFCSVVLKENDFIVAIDNKPYCTNCHKRFYP